jgi:hypothetical protein
MRKICQNFTGTSAFIFLICVSHPGRANVHTVDTSFCGNTVDTHPESSSILVSQVTSVSKFADVQPTDWAFGALQLLVERYGVIAGYPNGSFQGNRAMTRYEFAAGLSAALDAVNEFISTGRGNIVSRDDLATLQRLTEEFATELTALRERLDILESGNAELQANQFSTTTKLTGQAIIAVNAGGFDGERIINATGREIASQDPNSTILYRAVLDFNTSFVGTDQLKIRIDTGSNGGDDNIAGFLEPNFGSVIDYSIKPSIDNNIALSRLFYTLRPFPNFTVSLGPEIRTTDYIDRNQYADLSFRDFSTLALVNNYILFPIFGPSAGAAVDWNPKAGALSVRALYAASDAANPSDEGIIRGAALFSGLLYPNRGGNRGLFGDTYQSSIELEYALSRVFAVRLQYSGGELFDNRFDVFGLNFELAFSPQIAIFGRYGYGNYKETDFGNIKPNYWMAGVTLRDWLIPGSVAGIAAAQPFIASEIGNATQTNYEAFYKLPINDNISVTPSIQVITHPANQDANDRIVTGTLRTVFLF